MGFALQHNDDITTNIIVIIIAVINIIIIISIISIISIAFALVLL